jgi:hypothetical protein
LRRKPLKKFLLRGINKMEKITKKQIPIKYIEESPARVRVVFADIRCQYSITTRKFGRG